MKNTNSKEVEELIKDLSILIVEDELVNSLFLKEAFMRLPVKIECTGNGLDAVKSYKKNKFDIVLMDLRLPKLDGFEATREILKFDPNAKIIAQTAYAMYGDREKCLEAGFCDYITKPMKRDALIDIVIKWSPKNQNKK